MHSKLGRRLEALEQRVRPLRGIRVFTQDLDDPTAYWETDDGPRYGAADLHAFAEQGWTVLKVVYESRNLEDLSMV